MNDDALILFGGEVKAKKDGEVEGYLVLFGDQDNTDLSSKRDYFTRDTDFDLDFSTKTRLYYQHGYDDVLGTAKIGVGELKMDEVGVWVQAQIDLRQEYIADVKKRKKVAEYVEALYEDVVAKGACGWSSGVPSHLVRREAQENGANWVKYWPLGLDASLTPNPAEPNTLASVKSLGAKSSGLSQSCKEEILQRALMAKLKAEAGEDAYVYGWICDVYENSLVWRGEGGCYEASYTIDGLSATLGAPKQVQRLVSYKPLPDGAKFLDFSERDFEDILRDAGCPSRARKVIVAEGYKAALRQRDVDETPEPEPEPLHESKAAELRLRHLALRDKQLREGTSHLTGV